MIRCNNCRTENMDGSEYCDECGMKLDASLPYSSYRRDRAEPPIYEPPSAVDSDPISSRTMEGPNPTPPSFTTSTSIPKPAMPARDARPKGTPSGDGSADTAAHMPGGDRNERREMSGPHRAGNRTSEPPHPEAMNPPGPAHTYVLSSRGRTEGLQSELTDRAPSDGPRITAKLVIERGGRIGREFPITGIETNIGRWDADSGIFPDVDLDEDDPEAKISRRHARIINHNGQYFIEDLGSTNGTFVNRGRRLLPGKRHMLQNGDEVIVGKTFLKFQILR